MNIIESGPAGGVVGAQALARAKAARRRSSPSTWAAPPPRPRSSRTARSTRAHEYSVGAGIMIGSRLLTGAGYTLKVPAIDLAEVGAGGGSHVWIDAGGALQVGPESAGASPGPVCYDQGGDDADHHRRQCRARLHQSRPSGRRRAEAQRREGARGLRGQDRPAARHAGRAGGLRRAPDRRLQHDPRDQGGVDRARPRSARVRAVRLRRQRPAVRRRHGGGARHQPRGRAAVGRACSRRSACSMPTSSITTRAPSAACCARPTSARSTRLGRAGAPGERPARRRRLHRRARPAAALGGAALPGPELRADGAGARRADRRRAWSPISRRRSARSTSAPTAIAPAPTSRSSWSRSRSSAQGLREGAGVPRARAVRAGRSRAAQPPRPAYFGAAARLARDAGPAPLRSRRRPQPGR